MAEIGRNDPCPCGSGKKYKKCCERKNKMGFSATTQTSTPASSGIFSLFKKSLSVISRGKASSQVEEKNDTEEKKNS